MASEVLWTSQLIGLRRQPEVTARRSQEDVSESEVAPFPREVNALPATMYLLTGSEMTASKNLARMR